MPGVIDAEGGFHTVAVSSVEPTPCGDGRAGFALRGPGAPSASSGGTRRARRRLLNFPHARPHRAPRALTSARRSSSARACLAQPGSRRVAGRRPQRLHRPRRGRVAAMPRPRDARAPGRRRRRAEVLPIPVRVARGRRGARRLACGPATSSMRSDLAPGPTREVTVRMPAGRRAEFHRARPRRYPLARGELAPSSERVLTSPVRCAWQLVVRDDRGLSSTHPLPETAATLAVPPQPAAWFTSAMRGRGRRCPFTCCFRARPWDARPGALVTAPDVAAGALTLRRGEADVARAGRATGSWRRTGSPGHWRRVRSRSPTAASRPSTRRCAPVTDTSAWVSGTSTCTPRRAPTPRSLAARVLRCARRGRRPRRRHRPQPVTDYAPAARALGLRGRPATLPGDELTPAGRAWGHFNVPLAPGGGAPDDETPAYFDQTPASIFAAARELARASFQVNHRMGPYIGYFNVANLTRGRAAPTRPSPTASTRWRPTTVFWIESPDRIREGPATRSTCAAGMPGAHGQQRPHALLEEAGYPRTFLRASGALATRGARAVEASSAARRP